MKINKLIMCRPTFYDIEYSINPWMDVSNKVDKVKCEKQWNYAYDTLSSLGVDIQLIEPIPGLPDMTFPGDAGIVHGKKFISSNFRYLERQRESVYYKKWFREHSYEVIELPKNLYFEGLGDIIYYDNDIIFGYGPRSSIGSIEYVKEAVPEFNVLGELHLVDPSFFHIALAIAFIAPSTVLFYPNAFSKESQDMVMRNVEKVITVSENDAKNFFACNNIPIGNKILMDNCTSELERKLSQDGFEVIKCDMGEFKKSGGSIRCLVLKI